MEEALVAYLLANAGLADQFGTRINWLKRPQAAALPAITLQVVAGAPDYTMNGRIKLAGRVVQIDVWAASYRDMKRGQRAVVAALDGLKDAPFHGAFISSLRDGSEADQAGILTFYRASTDARIWHAAAD